MPYSRELDGVAARFRAIGRIRMLNFKTLLRRTGKNGTLDSNPPDAETELEKPLRGGLRRWRPSPRPAQKWQPPTKGTTPADRRRIRRRQARTPLK